MKSTCHICHAKITKKRMIMIQFFNTTTTPLCASCAAKKYEEANAHKIRVTKEDFKNSTWVGSGDYDSTSKITKELTDGDTLVLFFRRSYESGEIIHDSIYAKILDKYTIEKDLDIREHLLLPWQF